MFEYNFSSFKLVLKNIFFLSISELISKMLNFFTVAYLARIILPEGFGLISFAIAFVSYFIVTIDFGMDQYAVRKTAGEKSEIHHYVNIIITTRLLLFIILYSIMSLLTFLVFDDWIIITLILITGLNLFPSAISFNWVYQSRERMHINGIKQNVGSLLRFIGILLFVHSTEDVLLAAGISSLVLLFNSLMFFLLFTKEYGTVYFSLNYNLIKRIISNAFPLAAATFAIAIYHNLDIVMLGLLKSEYDVGIYSAAYKIFYIAITPLPIIASSFYPKLSEAGLNIYKGVLKIIKDYAMLMLSIGILSGIFFFTFARYVVDLIFMENYVGAVYPLMILSMNVIIVTVNMTLLIPLIAWGKEKKYLCVISLGAIVNLVLNIIFIPCYSYYGAALATLLAEFVVFILGIVTFNLVVKKAQISDKS